MPAKAGIHDFSRTNCVRVVLVVDAGLRRHDGMRGSKPMTFGIMRRPFETKKELIRRFRRLTQIFADELLRLICVNLRNLRIESSFMNALASLIH